MRKNIWPHTSFKNRKTYMTFRKPLKKVLADIPSPESKGNKPYTMTMEHFLDSLIYYHLDVPDSGRHLLQEVKHLISPGQTSVTDRYYQYHKDFDSWQEQGIHFVCRIRENTRKLESLSPARSLRKRTHDSITGRSDYLSPHRYLLSRTVQG